MGDYNYCCRFKGKTSVNISNFYSISLLEIINKKTYVIMIKFHCHIILVSCKKHFDKILQYNCRLLFRVALIINNKRNFKEGWINE